MWSRRGLSRFTTWAYKFVMFEIASKVARHAWRRQPPSGDEPAWDQLPDVVAPRPQSLHDLGVQVRDVRDREQGGAPRLAPAAAERRRAGLGPAARCGRAAASVASRPGRTSS